MRCHSFNLKGFGSGPLTRGVSGRQERRAEESAKLAAECRGSWTAEASDSLQEQRLPISHPSAGVHPQILSAQKPSEVPPFPLCLVVLLQERQNPTPPSPSAHRLTAAACSTQGTGERGKQGSLPHICLLQPSTSKTDLMNQQAQLFVLPVAYL